MNEDMEDIKTPLKDSDQAVEECFKLILQTNQEIRDFVSKFREKDKLKFIHSPTPT